MLLGGVCVCVCVHMYVHFGGQKTVVDILKLWLQVVVSCLMWFLVTEARPSARSASVITL